LGLLGLFVLMPLNTGFDDAAQLTGLFDWPHAGLAAPVASAEKLMVADVPANEPPVAGAVPVLVLSASVAAVRAGTAGAALEVDVGVAVLNWNTGFAPANKAGADAGAGDAVDLVEVVSLDVAAGGAPAVGLNWNMGLAAAVAAVATDGEATGAGVEVVLAMGSLIALGVVAAIDTAGFN
jgi:hypothetical protein